VHQLFALEEVVLSSGEQAAASAPIDQIDNHSTAIDANNLITCSL